jgi:hypothetical protein
MKSKQTFVADDGTITHGADAIAAMCAEIDAVQEHNRRALAHLKPHELARFESWLRTRTRATPPMRPTTTVRPANGRAPREARNTRRRGSRRGERATSSSSDAPDEPPAARPCACGCGRPRQPGKGQNYYDPIECKRAHDRERKRDQRERDRERSGAAKARPVRYDRTLGLVEDGWDRQRHDPYKDFDTVTWEQLAARAAAGCRCNGHHIADGSGEGCLKCGHWLPGWLLGVRS